MLDFLEKWQTVVVSFLGAFGVLIMAFLYIRFPSRREFIKFKEEIEQKTSEKLDAVKTSVDSDLRDFQKKLDKVPTTEDLHALELKIERLNTNIESVRPGLSNVQKLTDLLMENELREKRNGDS